MAGCGLYIILGFILGLAVWLIMMLVKRLTTAQGIKEAKKEHKVKKSKEKRALDMVETAKDIPKVEIIMKEDKEEKE